MSTDPNETIDRFARAEELARMGGSVNFNAAAEKLKEELENPPATQSPFRHFAIKVYLVYCLTMAGKTVFARDEMPTDKEVLEIAQGCVNVELFTRISKTLRQVKETISGSGIMPDEVRDFEL